MVDKFTFSMKSDKIQKLVKDGDYAGAARIADGIRWEEVDTLRPMTYAAAAYEKIKDYESAIHVLQAALVQQPKNRRLLYKLTGLAVADGNEELAEQYYKQYLEIAPEEPGRYLLRYLLAELKKEPVDKRIAILETYRRYEKDEEWTYRLAELYHEAGMGKECVQLCDAIILWYGVGPCVEAAMQLKEKYQPLSSSQQQRRENKTFYENRLKEVAKSFDSGELPKIKAEEEAHDEEDVRIMLQNAAVQTMESEQEGSEDRESGHKIYFAYGETQQEMIGAAVQLLGSIYEEAGRKVPPLAKIRAERMNARGLEDCLAHTAGKNLLVDQAGELTDSILKQMIYLDYESSFENLFVLLEHTGAEESLESRVESLRTITLKEMKQNLDAAKPAEKPQMKDLAETQVRIPRVRSRFAAEPENSGEDKPEISAGNCLNEPEAAAETSEDTVPDEQAQAASARKEEEASLQKDAAAETQRAAARADGPAEESDEDSMSAEAFMSKIEEILKEIDCVLADEPCRQALEQKIREMQEEEIPLTEKAAEELVDHAADHAEKRSLKRLFERKYDKNGCLILRDKDLEN